MGRVSARDAALITISAATAAAIALIMRLPKVPDENNLLGLIGSLIGAAVAVAAGLIVLGRQFETVDERQLNTIRQLLSTLRGQGLSLQHPDALLDPAKYADRAWAAMMATKSVARELQVNGPHIAAVAQLLWDNPMNVHLQRFKDANGGIAGPDLNARGEELVTLADDALGRLTNGL